MVRLRHGADHLELSEGHDQGLSGQWHSTSRRQDTTARTTHTDGQPPWVATCWANVRAVLGFTTTPYQVSHGFEQASPGPGQIWLCSSARARAVASASARATALVVATLRSSSAAQPSPWPRAIPVTRPGQVRLDAGIIKFSFLLVNSPWRNDRPRREGPSRRLRLTSPVGQLRRLGVHTYRFDSAQDPLQGVKDSRPHAIGQSHPYEPYSTDAVFRVR